MANRDGWFSGKFYLEQLEHLDRLLERVVNAEKDISLETYLKVCEQLGQEPDPERMPPTAEDFPYEVQVAFFIHDMLPAKVEGMSGTYMGKDIAPLSFLYEVYEIEDRKCVTDMIMRINNKYISHFQKKSESERKAQERKAALKKGR